MLGAVSMPRAGLAGENKQVFPAVACPSLVRKPVLDQPRPSKITEPEIKYERLHIGQRVAPCPDKFLEFPQGTGTHCATD